MTTSHLTYSRRTVIAATAGIAGLTLAHRARAQTPKLDTVNIVTAYSNIIAVQQELLLQQGFFKKVGIDAKFTHIADGSKLMGGIVTGEMDICPLAGIPQVFPAIQRGAAIKIVNGALLVSPHTVFSARPEIKSVQDLAGKTIGVGSLGALLHMEMVALLTQQGVDISTVTFANIGGSADIFRAIVQKLVDAGPGEIDNIPLASSYGVHVVQNGDMWKSLHDMPFQGGIAANSVIASKRDILVRTLAAYAMLFRFMESPQSHDAFIAARNKSLQGKGENFQRASEVQWQFFQTAKPFPLDLIIPRQGIANMQNLALRLGVQKRISPYDEVMDLSLPHDAVKLL